MIAVSGKWALGADDLQWILYRRRSEANGGWKALSFVSSTRGVLERCMREADCLDEDRAVLVAGLPPTFNEWRETLCPRCLETATDNSVTLSGMDNPPKVTQTV
jgi:hypothetical protein